MCQTHEETAVVIGNTGGIGKSVYAQLKSNTKYSLVYGFNKTEKPIIDLYNEKSIKEVAEYISLKNIKINLLFIATGFLHDNLKFPEKRVEDIDMNFIRKTFQINAIGIALIIKYFCPLMDHKNRSVFSCLSAKVGSIEDNFLGGWYSYRASKAALNQLIKTVSIEYKRRNSELIFISMHPGTVKTKLSEPFSNKNRKMFLPEESAEKIIDTLNKVDISYSGKLLDYNGTIIPF